MPISKLPNAPTPKNFADLVESEILQPAAAAISPDGVLDDADAAKTSSLSGAQALATTAIDDRVSLTGSPSPEVAAFVAAAKQRALDAAAAVTGPDGRLSKADVDKMPQEDLRLAFHYFRTGEAPTVAPAGGQLTIPQRPGVTFSENVFREVAEAYGLTDGEALVDKALEIGDGNAYLNRTELESAAQSLVSQATGDPTAGYDWSDNVVDQVMDKFGILDRQALLEKATRYDLDGNRYLKRSELEAGAKALTGQIPELKVITDIDKTVLPPHGPNDPLPAPYPGVTMLLRLLEFGPAGLGQSGDVHMVTARTPDRVAGLPDYFAAHDVPSASIDTGISTFPWVAQGEKVADISRILDAEPDRQVVLFGDSSHRDPEAYKEIQAKYGDRIEAAFIHKVNNPNPARVAGLHLIENYAQAAAILLQKGVIDEPSARAVMVSAQVEGLSITDAEIEQLLDDHRP